MFEEENKIILPKNFDRKIYFAGNETFLHLLSESNFQIIFHMDRKGNILSKHVFRENIEKIMLIEKQKVLVPLIKQNKLAVINLKEGSVRQIPFDFMNDNVRVQLHFFKESGLVCLNEQTKIGGKYIRLTYFSNKQLKKCFFQYSFINSKKNIDRVFKFDQNQGNNHSLVYFLKNSSKHNALILLHSLDLKNKEVQILTKKVQFPILKRQNSSAFRVWQVKKNQLIVTPTAYHPENSILLINFSGQVIKKIGFSTQIRHYLQPFFLRIFFAEKRSQLLNQSIHSIQQVSTMAEYLMKIEENETQYKLIRSKISEFAKLTYFTDTFDEDVLFSVDIDYQQSQKQSKMVGSWRKILLLNPLDMYMTFLLHLNEDFDDDLLFDAITLLDKK